MQVQTTETSTQQDDWTLNTEQMIFMLQHHNLIEAGFAEDGLELLRGLADSEAFKAVFGAMNFDEAYDRYECVLGDGRDAA